MASIDAWVKRQKNRVEAAEQLAEIWREFPDLIQELVASVSLGDRAEPEIKNERLSGAKRPRAKSAQNLEKVKAVLLKTTQPMTLQEIAEQAFLTRSAVRHVVEALYPDEFTSAPSEIDRRATVWRLRPTEQTATSGEISIAEIERIIGNTPDASRRAT